MFTISITERKSGSTKKPPPRKIRSSATPNFGSRSSAKLAAWPSSSSQTGAKSIESKSVSEPESESKSKSKSKSSHINLFEGIRIFDPVTRLEAEGDDKRGGFKRMKMAKKEAPPPKVVTVEDEKYRLGYGVAGKGVKLPRYVSKPSDNVNGGNDGNGDDDGGRSRERKKGVKSSGKKTLEEMREERLKREKREKERERALVSGNSRSEGTALNDRRFSRRPPPPNATAGRKTTNTGHTTAARHPPLPLPVLYRAEEAWLRAVDNRTNVASISPLHTQGPTPAPTPALNPRSTIHTSWA